MRHRQCNRAEIRVAHQFKVGDVVYLNSGGPQMTVTDIRRDSIRTRIACMWFASRKQQTGFFFAETLKPRETAAEIWAQIAAKQAAAASPSPPPEPEPAASDDWYADEVKE
jgi:uncharacterized protein YodC (DUF2158 family)